MAEKLWWHGPLRVIQDNLQVKDTPLMDPAVIACETREMNANALVINVGGIYAWYPSKVKYHHINEYLPSDYDLLACLIEECHRYGVKLIARFDFSKTDDYVSQERPDWFIRRPDGSRVAYGQERPGNWSILYNTCINAGYRNHELAVPVLEEVLDGYEIDGIFLNAPNYEYCTCDLCRKKYFEIYHKPLPIEQAGLGGEATYGHQKTPDSVEKSFPGICYRDNISNLYQAVKRKRPDLPFILYYGIYNERIQDRLLTADMICTEAQDVLSRGWKNGIPPLWYPSVVIKMGRTQPEGSPKPFGIIHSCPGMDWRHTGLPQAEYRPWLRMIPAAGGTLWHSITGFNRTVTDKRILQAVSDVNTEITMIGEAMDGAWDYSDALLLWNNQATHGWAHLLTATQTLYDICNPDQLTPERLARYPMVILPDDYPLTAEIIAMLRTYAEDGGNLVIEGTTSGQLLPFAEMIGITDNIRTSEALTACYWQFEAEAGMLRRELQDSPILAYRGVTAYTHAVEGTRVLATLIPPFAPLNSVGSPPERASILVKHTDLPLCTMRSCGKGWVVLFTGRISELADTYRLADFYQIWTNLADMLLGEKRRLRMNFIPGIVANGFRTDRYVMIHMVNMVGQRPLAYNQSVTEFGFRISLPMGRQALSVEGPLHSADFTWLAENSAVTVNVKQLRLWEMFRITLTD